MNIACTACSARYGVADEKLVGKRVRITCKRCGTVLIVDGNHSPPLVSASTSMAPSPPTSNRPAPEVKQSAVVPEPPFMVAFADGRQEPGDVAQIVRFHRAGQLGTDSLVWREGMSDWADPWDVEEIAAAFRRMGYARPTPAPNPPPARQPLNDDFDDEATQIHESSPQHAAPLFDDSEDTRVVDSSSRGSPAPVRDHRVGSRQVSDDDDVPTHVGVPARRASARASSAARAPEGTRRVATQPPAQTESPEEEYRRARREAKTHGTRARTSRPPVAPKEDLFARHASATTEEEQVPQPALSAGHELDVPRLTGARNESSVLFSLDSLLKQEQKSLRPAPRPRRDESFLVDAGTSLPMGGGIAPALSAPDFNAPISAPPPPEPSPYGEERARSSRAWLYLLVLVALGGGGAIAWKTGALRPVFAKLAEAPGGTAAPTATPSATSEHATLPSASASASAAASAPAASASAGPTASAGPSASTTASGKPSAPAPTSPTAHAAATSTATRPSSATTTSPKETSTAAKENPASAKETPTAKEPPGATAAPATGGGAEPFDASAAKEALSGATANVANCKEMGGPTGAGRVSITFAPSGRPTSVAVTGDLAGTTVGSCIARLYRAVHVPAFSGDPVTVAKSFSVQ